MPTYLVSLSGGAGSTLALHRALERYGPCHVEAVFADTCTEDPSLYELLRRIPEIAGIEPVRLGDGRTIWDVFDEQGIIRTPTGACKASLELKQKPIARYVADRFEPGEAVIVSGLEYSEPERRERFDDKWSPYDTWHPLADRPRLSACEIVAAVEALGYPEQTLYEYRYGHNNCGGGCILAGLGQWHGLYLDFPQRYRWHEERERQFNAMHREDQKPFTVLRDQSAKPVKQPDGSVVLQRKVTPLTLERFRERIEQNDPTLNLRDFRTACGCFLGEQTNLFDL